MDFGKLSNISRVDFRWPDPSPDTFARNLERLRTSAIPSAPAKVQVHVGCPAWGHREWIGTVYPLNARPPDFLELYARQFNTIELNTTHYRVPTLETVQDWCEKTPPGFRFCPKFPQEISHHRELVGCVPLTKLFCESLLQLGERLGTSFLQLSPSFNLNQLPVLKRFLGTLPSGFPLNIEFRHPSWFEGPALVTSARAVLETAGAGTVITDVAGRRDVFHLSLTSPRLLVRFIGNELDPTDYSRIQDWVRGLRSWIHQGLQEIYFMIHQPDDRLGPELISYFIQEMNAVTGSNLKDWTRRDSGTQLSLL